jgi:O-methyltransferase
MSLQGVVRGLIPQSPQSPWSAARSDIDKGDVLHTIPEAAPSTIALLRRDRDFYESTRHELAHLYPRLSSGGVLIIDDYGHWQGARQAVDEYFSALVNAPLLARIDYTGRLAVKA